MGCTPPRLRARQTHGSARRRVGFCFSSPCSWATLVLRGRGLDLGLFFFRLRASPGGSSRRRLVFRTVTQPTHSSLLLFYMRQERLYLSLLLFTLAVIISQIHCFLGREAYHLLLALFYYCRIALYTCLSFPFSRYFNTILRLIFLLPFVLVCALYFSFYTPLILEASFSLVYTIEGGRTLTTLLSRFYLACSK